MSTPFQLPDFSGQAVIVTGASRGIGRATAVAFALCGASVVINYHRDLDGAQETLAQVQQENGKAAIIQADVGLSADAERMVAQTESEFGPIAVLVNNAAAFSRKAFLDVSQEELDLLLATNVRGLFYLSQQVARRMAQRRKGSIIHISSILSTLAVNMRSVYCATKGAVDGLTRAMAMDLIPYNIRVNAISPGMIQTEALAAGFQDPELFESLKLYIPGRRLGKPEEIAKVVVFLASDAASYINGQVIAVDSGLSVREAGPPPKNI